MPVSVNPVTVLPIVRRWTELKTMGRRNRSAFWVPENAPGVSLRPGNAFVEKGDIDRCLFDALVYSTPDLLQNPQDFAMLLQTLSSPERDSVCAELWGFSPDDALSFYEIVAAVWHGRDHFWRSLD